MPTNVPQFIDTPRALELLRKAVADKGEEYVYPHANSGCVNVEYDDDIEEYYPSCIVGHALYHAGIDPAVIAEAGADEASVEELSYYGIAEFSEDAENVMSMAQLLQDRGFLWGVALKAAERIAETGEDFLEVYEEYSQIRGSATL